MDVCLCAFAALLAYVLALYPDQRDGVGARTARDSASNPRVAVTRGKLGLHRNQKRPACAFALGERTESRTELVASGLDTDAGGLQVFKVEIAANPFLADGFPFSVELNPKFERYEYKFAIRALA